MEQPDNALLPEIPNLISLLNDHLACRIGVQASTANATILRTRAVSGVGADMVLLVLVAVFGVLIATPH